MFFQTEMRAAILAGRKHVTRRIWKRPQAKVGGIYKVRKGRYSKEFYFKIRVLEISKQLLGEMKEEDAIAEGFEPYYRDGELALTALNSFRAYWISLHGLWDECQEVYVIRFEVIP